MGEVYLVEDTALERKVTLKFLPDYLQQDEVAQKRILREAKSAAALDHSYICSPRITLDPQIYADRKHVSAWKINLDKSWNEANIWQERLQLFFATQFFLLTSLIS